MALHRNNCPPCPSRGSSFSAISSAETSLAQKTEECGQQRTHFQQAEQTWLWRQGGSVYTSNKGDVHTWGFCGTWAAAQSTKSWSWESLWRPFITLGNFKEYHHNSKTPPNVILPCSSASPLCWLSPVTDCSPVIALGRGWGAADVHIWITCC